MKECPDDKDGTQDYPAICSNDLVTNLGGPSGPVVPVVITGPGTPPVDPVATLAPQIDDAEVEPGELYFMVYLMQSKINIKHFPFSTSYT